ncbi:hypothetical protein BJX61DRAFT_538185 [Aspergillus egyptiacus]|nr:hypothetical protein BJX61DRAFT_538185 [Aspergillus egyptiacus]
MSPKRAAEDNSQANKRSKTSATDQPPTLDYDKSLRSDRWSEVSVSGNIQVGYSLYADYDKWEYDDDDYDEDDEDDEEDEEDEDRDADEARPKKAKCDGGETCMCNKPAAEHPDHPLVMNDAGRRKFVDQIFHTDIRTPDYFDMYVFNDFAGYGILEVLQKLVLDFVEAKNNWKEQWAVCEAIPFFWHNGDLMPFSMLDRDTVHNTWTLIAHMFMAMLGNLESAGFLSPESEVKNLGLIMSMYLRLASELTEYSCLPEYSTTSRKTFKIDNFNAYIVAYAKKYEIKLKGPSGLDELIEEAEDEGSRIKFPAPSADPWKFNAAYKANKQELGTIYFVDKEEFGGDSFDITAWPSAKRKKYNFEKKDPIDKEGMKAIKEGGVMQMR